MKKRRILTEKEIITLRAQWEFGIHQDELAKQYGIAQSTVSYICRAKTYKHVPLTLSYELVEQWEAEAAAKLDLSTN